jgi:7-carboxy-7-deazaguanine synthase
MIGMVGERPLLVAETFGPTLQGEGPSCGQQALFVRLSRCNLSCPSCDTPYTWDWQRFDIVTETHRLSAVEILDWALGHRTELLVVTGGKPLLQQDLLVSLVTGWAGAGRRVEVETNGTLAPAPALVEAGTRFNVSPKLASFAAPGDARRRINPEALRALVATGRAVFKCRRLQHQGPGGDRCTGAAVRSAARVGDAGGDHHPRAARRDAGSGR